MPAPVASMIDPRLDHQSSSMLRESGESIQSQLERAREDDSTRSLPPVDITDESIDQSYVQFILYCNPSIPVAANTDELKKGFRSPPKSDGKIFSTFVLFELIRRLEAKELNTWTQLVIELGVEPPDTSKNQSAQKVQQYAVRLKRWLRAFHIDAFFQYCIGKPHQYYTQLPEVSQPLTETLRDGVPPEEDLALRALLPEWRPKRGRRKAEDAEDEQDHGVKRAQRDSSMNAEELSAFHEDYSALPQSAFPWSEQNHNNAWAAAHIALAPKTPSTGTTATTHHFRTGSTGHDSQWKLGEHENTPLTPYPQSAITPRHGHASSTPIDTPLSAHPGRIRKRHGPAVSAAWQSGNSSTGKLRGRPPSNRSVQDGPFSTFPANPQSRESTPIRPSGTPTHILTPSSGVLTPEGGRTGHFAGNLSHASGHTQTPVRKPSKLQLQVPQHSGGPVRLATPPRVLVNGEDDDLSQQGSYGHERNSSADFFNELEDEMEDPTNDLDDDTGSVDWKRRAQLLKRKLKEKEEELQALRRRVLEAVM